MSTTRILVAAGASGGHVYPALATAEVLRRRGHEVVVAGGGGLESVAVPAAGFFFHRLSVRRPPSVRYEFLTPRGLGALGSIVRASVEARSLMRRLRPGVVLSTGGYAALPTALAAAAGSLPLVLHEQNALLGAAHRLVVHRARVLASGLPLASPPRGVRLVEVGVPLRPAVAALAGWTEDDRAAARRRLGLREGGAVLLVVGGSLGSRPLNELAPRLALPDEVEVLHLAGQGGAEAARRAWAQASRRAVVLEYLEHMEDAWGAATVVLSRSGASTVAELAVAGLAAVLVPLPTLRRGDQEANARVLERAGAAVVLRQDDDRLCERAGEAIARLVQDAGLRARMSAAARRLARPDAAERLADLVEKVAAES